MNEYDDTDQIQKAIEQNFDDDTATLPLLPLTEDLEEAEPEPDPVMPAHQVRVQRWFFTFMCMNIPIVGWIYLFNLAFSKKRTDRREFARAYLYYKLVFLIIAAVILGILLFVGIGLLDQLLAYMEML